MILKIEYWKMFLLLTVLCCFGTVYLLNIVVPTPLTVGGTYQVLFQHEKSSGSEFVFYVIEDQNSPDILSEKILFKRGTDDIKYNIIPKTKAYNWFYYDRLEESKTYDTSIDFDVDDGGMKDNTILWFTFKSISSTGIMILMIPVTIYRAANENCELNLYNQYDRLWIHESNNLYQSNIGIQVKNCNRDIQNFTLINNFDNQIVLHSYSSAHKQLKNFSDKNTSFKIHISRMSVFEKPFMISVIYKPIMGSTDTRSRFINNIIYMQWVQAENNVMITRSKTIQQVNFLKYANDKKYVKGGYLLQSINSGYCIDGNSKIIRKTTGNKCSRFITTPYNIKQETGFCLKVEDNVVKSVDCRRRDFRSKNIIFDNKRIRGIHQTKGHGFTYTSENNEEQEWKTSESDAHDFDKYYTSNFGVTVGEATIQDPVTHNNKITLIYNNTMIACMHDNENKLKQPCFMSAASRVKNIYIPRTIHSLFGYDEDQSTLYGLSEKQIIFSYNLINHETRLVTKSAWQTIKTNVVLALQIDRNVLVGKNYKLHLDSVTKFGWYQKPSEKHIWIWEQLHSSSNDVSQVEEFSFKSCSEIKNYNPNLSSGVYYIRSKYDAAFKGYIYCDMETSGGGWAMAANISNGETVSPQDEILHPDRISPTKNQAILWVFYDFRNKMGFSQIRFYCINYDTGEKLHFMNTRSAAGQLYYNYLFIFRSAAPSPTCFGYQLLPGHNSNLGAQCENTNFNDGHGYRRMYEYPLNDAESTWYLKEDLPKKCGKVATKGNWRLYIR